MKDGGRPSFGAFRRVDDLNADTRQMSVDEWEAFPATARVGVDQEQRRLARHAERPRVVGRDPGAAEGLPKMFVKEIMHDICAAQQRRSSCCNPIASLRCRSRENVDRRLAHLALVQ